VVGCCEQVHQIAGGVPVGSVFERYVEVGSMPKHVEQRPKRKSPRTIGFKAEIDAKPI